MSPLQFRAWDTSWNRWILPNDIAYSDGKWWFERRGEDGGDVIETADLREIVLMQSTGLRDSVGTEVFEGDILRVVKDRYLIQWDNLQARFVTQVLNRTNVIGLMTCLRRGRVIGNKHQHPELLPSSK